MAVIAGEEAKDANARPVSVSQRIPAFSGGVGVGDIELGLKKT